LLDPPSPQHANARHPPTAQVQGANALVWLLLVIAVFFAILRPRGPADLLRLIDWPTMAALAGLLAITQGVEQSGVLQSVARRVLTHATDLRQLAFLLTGIAAVLAALITNDVSLFLLVPLTRALAAQASVPVGRLVVLQALAVNAGSALTPVGNPQNLFLWHRSAQGIGPFMLMMAPTVLVMIFWLIVAVWLLVPATPITLEANREPHQMQPRLLTLSGALFICFLAALNWHWPLEGLALVVATYLLYQRRVLLRIDWALLAIIALMFIDLRQLTQLPFVAGLLDGWPISEGWLACLAGIVTSQFISNVPATILLDPHVHDLPALAAGVNVGGFGSVIGSLANIIALRLARTPRMLGEFHKISFPFLLVCSLCVLLMQK